MSEITVALPGGVVVRLPNTTSPDRVRAYVAALTNLGSTPAMPATLTAKEAAEYLRLSPNKLYELTSKGQIPVRRVGKRKNLYRKDDLDSWLDR